MNKHNIYTIGEKIRFLRESHGYTQAEIADKLDVGRSVYSCYECDKRNISIQSIIKLTKIYNITSDFLLGLTNNPFGSKTETIEKYLSPIAIKNIKKMVEAKTHTNLKALNTILSHPNSGYLCFLLNSMMYSIENKKTKEE